MKIEPKFNYAQIAKAIAAAAVRLDQAIILRLKRVGENFIKSARTIGDYKDQTGNLRSSIGYAIIRDGKIIFDSFPGRKVPGVNKGRDLVNRLKMEFETVKGYCLVVVAGMEYAAHVESKGRNVLTASGLEANTEWQQTLDQLFQKLSKRK